MEGFAAGRKAQAWFLDLFHGTHCSKPKLLAHYVRRSARSSVSDVVAGLMPRWDWSIKQSPKEALLTRYHGLGINGTGVGLELLRKGVTDFSDGYTSYYTALEPGKYRVRVKCLPTFAIANGQLRFSVKINQGEVKERNVHTEAETARWKQNVVNGFSYAEIDFEVKEKEGCSIELRWLDPGLIINTLEIYHRGNNL